MTNPQKSIVLLTAGAGGMYCGSCIHDNTLAAGLQHMGIDAVLVPTYTPIRTDEENVSIDRVFLGGINVYLQQKLALFRYLPDVFLRWLDQPGLIRWVTSRSMETDASKLGQLTLSMLQGERGHQRREVERLCRWLATSIRPRMVVFSNLLIAGCAPLIQRELGIPVLVTLQGDDVFLDQLPPADRQAAMREMRRIAESIDGFLTHSQYYADHMADYLGLDRQQFHRIPLAVRADDFVHRQQSDGPLTETLDIGYLARLAPEKGLHLLCDAFIELRKHPATRQSRLHVAGWLGNQHKVYADDCLKRVRRECGNDAVHFVGEVDRAGKIEFLQRLDVLSVPSPYREPKGIYVMEALAAGVPVVQPDHGAFPEWIRATNGGLLFEPNKVTSLTKKLTEILTDAGLRSRLGQAGQQAVRAQHDVTIAAAETLNVWQSIADAAQPESKSL